MKKNMFRCLVHLLTVIFILFQGTVTASAAQNPLPETLDIGLFFRTSSKSTAQLQTESGFEVSIDQDGQRQPIDQLPQTKTLILRKDTYYLGTGGNFVEYTGPIQEKVGQMSLQGPYRLQVGKAYDRAQEAEDFLNSLKGLVEQPYLAYEDGWRVYYGLFITEEAAQGALQALASASGTEVTLVHPSSTRVQIMDGEGVPLFTFDSKDPLYFSAIEEKAGIPLVKVEGSRYRGAITAKRSTSSDMAIINRVPLEEYLYGVVPKEMPASWPLEALKAQAVAARGYGLTITGKYQADGFDLCNTTTSQVYGGYDSEHPNTNRAVDETRGIVLTYQGELITPYFHSNSGGQTESSENIWSSALPYLKGVKDPYSEGTPNATWSTTFTLQEMEAALKKANIQVGEVKSLQIKEVSENGRVLTLVIIGSNGEAVLKKDTIRSVFSLRSTWFSISLQGKGAIWAQTSEDGSLQSIDASSFHVISAQGVQEVKNSSDMKIYNGETYGGITASVEGFTFEGKGYGHGIGMSQHGAKTMAEMNYSYDQILTHYFTGVKVESR